MKMKIDYDLFTNVVNVEYSLNFDEKNCDLKPLTPLPYTSIQFGYFNTFFAAWVKVAGI